MGRHSRRKSNSKGDSADGGIGAGAGAGTDVNANAATGKGSWAPLGRQRAQGPQAGGPGQASQAGRPGRAGQAGPAGQGARPGAPRSGDGNPGRGEPRFADGTPAHGFPRLPDGTPAHGFPRLPDGTPARGVPRLPDGTPAHGMPRFSDGTPAHGTPRFPDGTPARGVPQARAGHPEQAESGGGWGELRGRDGRAGVGQGGPRGYFGVPQGGSGAPQGPQGSVTGVSGVAGRPHAPEAGGSGRSRPAAGGIPGVPGAGMSGPPVAGPVLPIPRQRQAPQTGARRGGQRGRGPRQDYVDAFDGDSDGDGDVFAPRTGVAAHRSDPYASVTDWPSESDTDNHSPTEGGLGSAGAPPVDRDLPGVGAGRAKSGKGRAYTGIAAAAVTTVLAVVVAGQVASDGDNGGVRSEAATDQARDVRGTGAASAQPSASATPRVATLTYAQKMDKKYPLGATLKGPDKFDAVPGVDKAPGKGRKYTYRVDVEQGLGLDGTLFAEAVQKTLNDNRSWAHNGARTFERIYSGKPDFVITLASPGTTAKWCAKSGLDTTEDNVSCDSAATERVLINAYRWAQGSSTYGDKMYAYRQMLINHEVGHRLGYGHVTCDKDGELAPVMQQQTKFLDHDGIHCLANPWPYPGS
ncbi:DUF3152 domain-containing protein [Streptomyces sp. MBT62]|nr:DUF3152 domain-containing protein [Streptomyces sp. MBT62]MBK3570577.1 DUF3152 domain-containing protein [Streptomyces sp. MBT62]